MKTIIIIPARMASKRFPNKPMALIDGVPMIQRVWLQAKNSDIGPVIVACCEIEVFDLINSIGGTAIMTNPEHPSGTDRIFEALKKYQQADHFDSIINLQGDMPLINPLDIKNVAIPLKQGFDIGTLVTNLSLEEESDPNITKAKVSWIKINNLGEVSDFYKISKKTIQNIYHHVGVYSFSYKSLKKFVEINPTKNELKYKLEQLRAIDFDMKIAASYLENVQISVDTKDDLIKVENIIKGIE
tara:strand:+ start:100 stop:828 length:729 start_codon:yes stop_codon:yes gene_type:complete